MNTMSYKGYLGSIEYDADDPLFYGRLLHIRSLVSYEAADVAGLVGAFQEAVDDYLNHCRQRQTHPEIPTAPA